MSHVVSFSFEQGEAGPDEFKMFVFERIVPTSRSSVCQSVLARIYYIMTETA
jgi:hypothetical protein